MQQAREQIVSQCIKQAENGFAALVKAVIDKIGVGSTQASETAADTRAMSLAAAAGYDPNAMRGILERFKGLTGDYGGANYSEERGVEAESVRGLLSYEAKGGNGSNERLDSIRDASRHAEIASRAQPTLSDTRVMLLMGLQGEAEESSAPGN